MIQKFHSAILCVRFAAIWSRYDPNNGIIIYILQYFETACLSFVWQAELIEHNYISSSKICLTVHHSGLRLHPRVMLAYLFLLFDGLFPSNILELKPAHMTFE